MAIPKKPEDVRYKALARNPRKYAESLTKIQATGLAVWLNYQYHTLNKSKVPDEAFDILIDVIENKWPKSEVLKQIGSKVAKKPRNGVIEETLPLFMPSMDKAKPGSSSLKKFLSAGSYTLMDKLDGISLQLEYVDGVLTHARTRGNGRKGQRVSGVIPALRAPKHIPERGRVLVRCEFVVPRKTFDAKFSKYSGAGTMSNGRNMGGGLLTRNVPSSAVKSFHVVAYEISAGRSAGKSIDKQLQLLKRWKFTTVRSKTVKNPTEQQLSELHDEFKRSAKYDIDGIIVAKQVGYSVGTSNPKHAKAFKINSLENSKIVAVKDVVWEKSRLGRWIPRVEIDKIQLGGVEVSYFAGHSHFYIQHGFTKSQQAAAKKEGKKLPVRPLGKGAQIRVIRSGDVIPYIMEVVKPSRKPSTPPEPFTLDTRGVHALAPKEKNAESKQKNVLHFFSSLKIDGVKSGTVKKLYDGGFTSIKRILDATEEDILTVDGLKETSARNIVNAVRKGTKNRTFAELGYASSVFGDSIGSRLLEKIESDYSNVLTLALKHDAATLEDMFRQVEGIKTKARTIARRLPKFLKFIKVHGLKVQTASAPKVSSNKLASVHPLFTGIRDKELSALIKENGGKEASGVSSATHLITKEGYSNKKTDVAEEKGIPIMTVEQFRNKFKL